MTAMTIMMIIIVMIFTIYIFFLRVSIISVCCAASMLMKEAWRKGGRGRRERRRDG